MKALQYMEAGRPELLDIDRPSPGAGQVLVKVLGVTTCPHWDLHLMAGEPMFPGHQLVYPYTPGQPGHEAMGEVIELGPNVTDVDIGSSVVMWRDRGHGKPGCYAQYVPVLTENLLVLPQALPARQIASLELAMCVQCTLDMVLPLDALDGKRVAVSGLGPAGLVALQLARAYGAAAVIGIDPLPERRALAEKLGLDQALAPDSPDLPAHRRAPGAFDTGIDCTGLAPAVQSLMDRTRHLVTVFGVLRDEVRFGFQHWTGLILAGAGSHNRDAAERALEHVLAGRLDLAPLVSAELPLSRYVEGVELLRTKQAMKVCFFPWDE